MDRSRDRHDPEQKGRVPWDRQVTRRDLLGYGGSLGFGALGASMLASCTSIERISGSGGFGDQAAHLPPAQAKYVAIVIVDGCRADYLNGYASMPVVDFMARHGAQYVNAWTGSMESTTPACHAAIGTGRFAKNNGGILGFYWENPSTQSYGHRVDLTNNLQVGQKGAQYAVDPTSLEKILKQSNTPTMASLLKETDPTAKVYAGAGVKFYAVDAAGGPDADYITYFWNDGPQRYRPLEIPGHELPPGTRAILGDPALQTDDYTSDKLHTTINYLHPGQQDSLVVDLASRVIRRERPRIVILNVGEMDFPFGHETGGPISPHFVKEIMGNVDRAVGRLMDTYRDLEIFDQTVFAFLGDHGMVPLIQQVDDSPVWQAALKAGTRVAGGDFHTGGYVWLEDPDRAEQTATNIDSVRMPGVSAVYFRGSVGGQPQYFASPATAISVDPATDGAYRYLLETLDGANAPHIILVFMEDTGTLGAGGTSGAGRPNVWHGDHGGASWDSHHLPLVLYGAGIRKGHRSSYPARLVDLAPTLLRLLGVPFPLMDGIALADAFRRPLGDEIAAQRVMGRQLKPVAAALRARSRHDRYTIAKNGPIDPPPPLKLSSVKGISAVIY